MEKFWTDLSKTWAEIIAKSWSDNKFRDRVIADPVAVLREHGFDLTGGNVEFQVRPGSDVGVIQLPLPAKPEGLGEGSTNVQPQILDRFCSTCHA